ncbi:S-layer homology domain-containing protein [Candidatus Peregrinibacteria bacterium]|nr:S-layer homology domain-containing protein [Candidatus Peregrinibacteria bacterium]
MFTENRLIHKANEGKYFDSSMKFSSKFLAPLAVAVVLIFSQIFPAFADFSDVNDQTNYQNSILWMQQNQVINGYEDGTFKPDKCVNRAEFLKMLFKTLSVDSGKSTAELFPDTPDSEWYAPYIRTAREHKTIEGYKDGKFRPDVCVKRAEAIKMASIEFTNNDIPEKKWKFQGIEGMPADTQDSKLWFYKYLEYALKTNTVGTKHIDISKAEEKGPYYYEFLPNDSMSRKEVAEMLYRMKAIKDNGEDYYYSSDKKAFYEQEQQSYTFYKPDALVLKDAKANFQLDQILLTSANGTNTSYPEGNTFEFDVYLERPDLKLKENKKYAIEMPLTVDLPPALQPRLMYLTDLKDTDPKSQTGSMCDRPRFPHRCSDTLTNDELKLPSKDYLLKITFEDDSYIAKKITVPIPKPLNQPEITAPAKDATTQGSKFNVTFKDVGADSYEVSATMCKNYGNNSINPCLDEINYKLNRSGNTFTIKNAGGETPSNNATVEVKDGQITLKSDALISFESDMSYTIIASSTGKNEDGAKTSISNSDMKDFKK